MKEGNKIFVLIFILLILTSCRFKNKNNVIYSLKSVGIDLTNKFQYEKTDSLNLNPHVINFQIDKKYHDNMGSNDFDIILCKKNIKYRLVNETKNNLFIEILPNEFDYLINCTSGINQFDNIYFTISNLRIENLDSNQIFSKAYNLSLIFSDGFSIEYSTNLEKKLVKKIILNKEGVVIMNTTIPISLEPDSADL